MSEREKSRRYRGLVATPLSFIRESQSVSIMSLQSIDPATPQSNPEARESHPHAENNSLWPRMIQSTGTVYGDIGTSVLYTTMEITRETVLLKLQQHGLRHEEAAAMVAEGGVTS